MGRVENTQQFRLLNRNIKTDTTVDYKNQKALKQSNLLNSQPKTIICEAQAIKAERNISEIGEKAKGCSSEKERKVNALALRAEEGRDYLR